MLLCRVLAGLRNDCAAKAGIESTYTGPDLDLTGQRPGAACRTHKPHRALVSSYPATTPHAAYSEKSGRLGNMLVAEW